MLSLDEILLSGVTIRVYLPVLSSFVYINNFLQIYKFLFHNIGVDFGKAFDIPYSLEGSTIFAAVVLKVKKNYSIM